MGSGVAVFDPYTASVLTNIGINIVVTLSMYFPLAVDQLSIAQVGFMAIGAHLATVLTLYLHTPFAVALLAAALLPRLLITDWVLPRASSNASLPATPISRLGLLQHHCKRGMTERAKQSMTAQPCAAEFRRRQATKKTCQGTRLRKRLRMLLPQCHRLAPQGCRDRQGGPCHQGQRLLTVQTPGAMAARLCQRGAKMLAQTCHLTTVVAGQLEHLMHALDLTPLAITQALHQALDKVGHVRWHGQAAEALP